MAEKIAILGAGSWGTTFAALLADRHEVTLWARREAVADQINQTHVNSTYLGSHLLPSTIWATSSIEEAVDGAKVVILALPSHGMRSVLNAAALPSSVLVVVSLTKGLEEDTNLRMSEVIDECWAPEFVGVLTGPNLAREVLIGQPTATVIALRDERMAKFCQELFTTPTFRVYTNPDVVGCEIAGVAKNVMGIAIGMATGLGLGDNTRATLITRSLAEISRLGAALGGERQTFAGLAGLGDLIATSLSPQSRNFSFGHALGKGESIDQVLHKTRMVAEGFRSCRPVVGLADSLNVEVPVAREVVVVCHEGGSPQDSLKRLMSRAAKSEVG
jgi:glycerol-3-phosphate dehydrogenase (NAD(P)+)